MIFDSRNITLDFCSLKLYIVSDTESAFTYNYIMNDVPGEFPSLSASLYQPGTAFYFIGDLCQQRKKIELEYAQNAKRYSTLS